MRFGVDYGNSASGESQMDYKMVLGLSNSAFTTITFPFTLKHVYVTFKTSSAANPCFICHYDIAANTCVGYSYSAPTTETDYSSWIGQAASGNYIDASGSDLILKSPWSVSSNYTTIVAIG